LTARDQLVVGFGSPPCRRTSEIAAAPGTPSPSGAAVLRSATLAGLRPR
jgi:hypothetical protein